MPGAFEAKENCSVPYIEAIDPGNYGLNSCAVPEAPSTPFFTVRDPLATVAIPEPSQKAEAGCLLGFAILGRITAREVDPKGLNHRYQAADSNDCMIIDAWMTPTNRSPNPTVAAEIGDPCLVGVYGADLTMLVFEPPDAAGDPQNPYLMKPEDLADPEPQDDLWETGVGAIIDGAVNSTYDGVIFRGTRVAYDSGSETGSHPGVYSFQRPVTYDAVGEMYAIGAEIKRFITDLLPPGTIHGQILWWDAQHQVWQLSYAAMPREWDAMQWDPTKTMPAYGPLRVRGE